MGIVDEFTLSLYYIENDNFMKKIRNADVRLAFSPECTKYDATFHVEKGACFCSPSTDLVTGNTFLEVKVSSLTCSMCLVTFVD